MASAYTLTRLQLLFVCFGFGQTLEQAFFQRQKSQYLPDSVIETKYANSELECSLHCTALDGCLSANYEVPTGLCQLNNNTISEKGGVKDPNFVYLSIELLVGYLFLCFLRKYL